ncbi:MAG TPA: hypothetical protein VM487_19400 [Phycisphaerae bacterium]|nr:hypothetical protein [Phycisphaerae bacterium]
MDLKTLLQNVDAKTARAFIAAARHLIDAMLIEAQRVRQTQTPGARDYDAAELSRESAPGGWLSHEELRGAAQKMAEAVAAEKWTDGLVFAIRLFTTLGVA